MPSKPPFSDRRSGTLLPPANAVLCRVMNSRARPMSRRELLMNSLQATVHDLIRNLRTIDEAAARRAPTPEEWSIADVVAHLGYIEPLYLARLHRIVEQDNPFEPFLHPDRSAHDLLRPLNALLQQFILRRAETVVFLQG